jgi:DNA modification methylase
MVLNYKMELHMQSNIKLMGAEKSGRRCYSMELQPFYVDVIVQRWQNFTGKEATHAESGKTYAQLKADREVL